MRLSGADFLFFREIELSARPSFFICGDSAIPAGKKEYLLDQQPNPQQQNQSFYQLFRPTLLYTYASHIHIVTLRDTHVTP